MKHRINKPPGPHPYDRAREELKASGGGLFGVRLNEPIQRGVAKNGLFPWTGAEIVAFQISSRRGMNHSLHHAVVYTSAEGLSPWFVNLAATHDAEELARLATVFMDLINTQRIDT